MGVVVIVSVLVYATVRAAQTNGIALQHGSVSAKVGDLLSFGLLCGLMSYATVEVTKRLTTARGRFQASVVWRWMAAGIAGATRGLEGAPPPSYPFSQLVLSLAGGRLSVAGPQRPFAPARHYSDSALLPASVVYRVFNVVPEQLVAQMAGVADVAGVDPSRAFLLWAFLGRAPLLERVEESRRPRRDRPVEPFEPRREELLDAQDLRGALDALQVSLTQGWRRLVQLLAVALAGVYGVGLFWAGGLTDNGEARYLFAGLLLGGPIAWVVRDLTAAVERLRA